jgi:hypothetical protein
MLKKVLFHPSFPKRAETRSFPIFVLILRTLQHTSTVRLSVRTPCGLARKGARLNALGEGRVKWRTFLSILISCET